MKKNFDYDGKYQCNSQNHFSLAEKRAEFDLEPVSRQSNSDKIA